ncbi:MAG TPA: LacI family DNA-binding transcriptional regulator [Verrucomicrobiae bacterium]|jgi:LacI family transcriptional regulator|nr:LacI family DNA-binding transcriptional regulator [Verrucomicrobiae bacterium]
MVTQEDIARKLGISRQLVTFALAGYPQVSKASRLRILAAAREMGYQPNPHARALQRKRTGIIALWIPDQISTHYSHVARELNRLVRREQQELIISEMNAMEARQVLSNVPVDGVIAVDIPGEVKIYRHTAAERSIPLVSMGAYGSPETDSVQVDLHAGTKQVMSHLLGAGFRRIAHATFVHKNEPQAGRWLSYHEAMRKAGLKPEFIYYPLTERLRPAARQFIQDYIRQHGAPEAIFCHSDDAALGMYRGLCDLKLRVPEDVALVGCDGIEDIEYLECPLSTLVQPVEEMCATAWKFLMKRLEGPELKRQSLTLKPKLVIRESSARKTLPMNDTRQEIAI